MTKPLIEASRVRFSGLSTEAFEEPPIGDTRVFTVRATCTAITEQDMKSEGTRRTATMKIVEVREGVDPKIGEDDDAEPQLDFSDPEPASSEPESIGEVISGIKFDGGPVFSGGGN
ncbi:DUF7171 family protein [Rhodococcus sp. PD04]|uniref:DUF7171 family protein n=1 Tax=Rhodococcus sp. PD04 TaxID=3109594 RepID=UPI002DD8DBB4|nr:hypothetical protein [Rhodococcus sp. PD04]WSE22349.1 hypothetical protein U9J23_22290 [Rhodococcus sp. PD04]